MRLVEKLLENARQDTQLLIKNDKQGDRFERPRDVEFALKTSDIKVAETVCSFINDNQYGISKMTAKSGDVYWVLCTINMPTTQHLLCSVSAFMMYIAELFKAEYDGWGCILQTDSSETSQTKGTK